VKGKSENAYFCLFPLALKLVGAIGFEPTTSRSQTERTTRLCYAPIRKLIVVERRSRVNEARSNHTPPTLNSIEKFATRSMRVLASRSGEIWSSKQVPSSKQPSITA
jgi:hypothetical protein